MEDINHILLIDDNKTTLQLNKWLLKDFFPEEKITTLSSGNEAIAYIDDCFKDNDSADACLPLLIFCDVQMPDIKGWDLVEKLKADGRLDMEKVFIVLLSAYVHGEEAAMTCADKHITCINKPLTDENLEQVKAFFELSF